MLGTLYIVATPIGNLEDITLRALKILKEVDLILAEDTRVTRKLLVHYDISRFAPRKKRGSLYQKSKKTPFDIDTPILSYHQHSSDKKKLHILSEILRGKNIALVSDAGTPGISDPGNELIDFLLGKEPGMKIVPIPGASAVTTALSVCGFRADKFIFLGFLPKKKKNKLYDWLKTSKMTFAFYESPNRLKKTLGELRGLIGSDRRVFVARELTKLYETFYRGEIDEVIESLSEEKIRGEIVVVVEGK